MSSYAFAHSAARSFAKLCTLLLSKEFRFEGSEVRVSRLGDKVILEPLEKPPFDVKAWRARLDSYRDVDFPELPDDPPLEPDDSISFD